MRHGPTEAERTDRLARLWAYAPLTSDPAERRRLRQAAQLLAVTPSTEDADRTLAGLEETFGWRRDRPARNPFEVEEYRLGRMPWEPEQRWTVHTPAGPLWVIGDASGEALRAEPWRGSVGERSYALYAGRAEAAVREHLRRSKSNPDAFRGYREAHRAAQRLAGRRSAPAFLWHDRKGWAVGPAAPGPGAKDLAAVDPPRRNPTWGGESLQTRMYDASPGHGPALLAALEALHDRYGRQQDLAGGLDVELVTWESWADLGGGTSVRVTAPATVHEDLVEAMREGGHRVRYGIVEAVRPLRPPTLAPPERKAAQLGLFMPGVEGGPQFGLFGNPWVSDARPGDEVHSWRRPAQTPGGDQVEAVVELEPHSRYYRGGSLALGPVKRGMRWESAHPEATEAQAAAERLTLRNFPTAVWQDDWRPHRGYRRDYALPSAPADRTAESQALAARIAEATALQRAFVLVWQRDAKKGAARQTYWRGGWEGAPLDLLITAPNGATGTLDVVLKQGALSRDKAERLARAVSAADGHGRAAIVRDKGDRDALAKAQAGSEQNPRVRWVMVSPDGSARPKWGATAWGGGPPRETLKGSPTYRKATEWAEAEAKKASRKLGEARLMVYSESDGKTDTVYRKGREVGPAWSIYGERA